MNRLFNKNKAYSVIFFLFCVFKKETLAVEDRFREDAARRIAGAQEKHIVEFGHHALL